MFDRDEAGEAVALVRAESTALRIVADAMSTVQPHADSRTLARNEVVKLGRAKDLIESKLAERFTLVEIAGEVGIGVASLQRLFRSGSGMSVNECARTRRLTVAASWHTKRKGVVRSDRFGRANELNRGIEECFNLTASQKCRFDLF